MVSQASPLTFILKNAIVEVSTQERWDIGTVLKFENPILVSGKRVVWWDGVLLKAVCFAH
jgi:hypothetical protein